MSQGVFFVSDLHFGANPQRCHPNREAKFREFLETLPGRASHLYILGDLFEFWLEYREYVPKRHFAVLAGLEALARSGVQVHYLSGNHDFSLGRFFEDQLGLHTHAGSVEAELQGKKCLLLHGDGMAASDWKQRLAKKVMTHPASLFTYKLLHPDLGMSLARGVSGASRASHDNRPRKLDEYEKKARTLLGRGIDIVMHGHTHAAFVKELPEGRYVCTGEWMQRLNYVEMRDGNCECREFVPGEN